MVETAHSTASSPGGVPWRTVVQAFHLLAALLAIGGVFFVALILLPALSVLPPEQGRQLMAAIMPSFSVIVWIALPTFLASGVLMWLFRASDAGMSPGAFLRTRYSLLLLVKLALAHVVAAISLLLTLPGFEWAKAQAPLLMTVNAGVALAIILIAAHLRRMRSRM